MNSTTCLRIFGAAVLCFLPCTRVLAAEEGAPIDRVQVREGKLTVQQAGLWLPAEKVVNLSSEIKVFTNLTFIVKGGKERKLEEGQSLGSDGYLASADGRIEPVFDHVTMKSGQVTIARDGASGVISEAMVLGDGSRVSPDGVLVAADGRRSRLLDGQLIRLDGVALPAVDTITMRDGKVFVQKDGSALPVAAGRSMMMSEGTKVLGDGTVIMKDGTRVALSEGQVIKFEGVAVRRR